MVARFRLAPSTGLVSSLTIVSVLASGCVGPIVHGRTELGRLSAANENQYLILESSTDYLDLRLHRTLIAKLQGPSIGASVVDGRSLTRGALPSSRYLVRILVTDWKRSKETVPAAAVLVYGLGLFLIVPLFFGGTIRRGVHHTANVEVSVLDLNQAPLLTEPSEFGAVHRYDASTAPVLHRKVYPVELDTALGLIRDETDHGMGIYRHESEIADEMANRILTRSWPDISAALASGRVGFNAEAGASTDG